MKKILFLLLIAMLAFAGPAAFGQESEKKSGPAIMEWLKSLQKKIDQIVPKKTMQVTNSVAGVRGAKENGQAQLYWKGKKGDEPVSDEELGIFRKGVDLAATGDTPGAVKELEEFMKQYPDSALIPDAKKTLDLVKAQGAGADPASAKER